MKYYDHCKKYYYHCNLTRVHISPAMRDHLTPSHCRLRSGFTPFAVRIEFLHKLAQFLG